MLPVLLVVPVGPLLFIVPVGPLLFIVPVAFIFIKAVVFFEPLLTLLSNNCHGLGGVKILRPIKSSIVVFVTGHSDMLDKGPVVIFGSIFCSIGSLIIEAVVLLKPHLALVLHFLDICVFSETISPLFCSLIVLWASFFNMHDKEPIKIFYSFGRRIFSRFVLITIVLSDPILGSFFDNSQGLHFKVMGVLNIFSPKFELT